MTLTTTEAPRIAERTSGTAPQCGDERQTWKYKNKVELTIQNEAGETTPGGIGGSLEPKGIADFWCDGYPCKVHGLQAEKHQLVTPLGAYECNSATFDGTPIEAAADSISVHPKYEECILNPTIGEDRPATVTMNGCYYKHTVHFHETGNGAGIVNDEYSGYDHLICPEHKSIEVHVFNDAGHTGLRCTFHIEPQTIYSGIDYKDHTGSAVTVTTIEAPTKAKRTSGAVLQCGGESQTWKYKSKVEFKIQKEGGATTTGGITTKP